jgi:RNA polymerase sigma factor (sigma-70 family)
VSGYNKSFIKSSALENTPSTTPDPEDAMQQEAMLAVLHECVAELPEELRTVCELLFGQGLKQSEVAARLNLSEPTLSRRKQEACNRLKSCLRRKGVTWMIE